MWTFIQTVFRATYAHITEKLAGGDAQPGCSLLELPSISSITVEDLTFPSAGTVGRHLVACAHNRAIDLYIDSIRSQRSCPMVGHRWRSLHPPSSDQVLELCGVQVWQLLPLRRGGRGLRSARSRGAPPRRLGGRPSAHVPRHRACRALLQPPLPPRGGARPAEAGRGLGPGARITG
jgi:hypothetical protein